MRSSTARIVLPLALIVTAGLGTAAFAVTPQYTYYPPPPNCTTVYEKQDLYVGYENSNGRVGACAGSSGFVDESYAKVLNGTNKGVIVNSGFGGPDYGAWVGSGQVCVLANWDPTCRAVP